MPTTEEFEALKKQVADLEALVHRIASSHKDVVEKYLPQAVNALNEGISKVATRQTDIAEKLAGTMNHVSTLVAVIANIQSELDFRAELP